MGILNHFFVLLLSNMLWCWDTNTFDPATNKSIMKEHTATSESKQSSGWGSIKLVDDWEQDKRKNVCYGYGEYGSSFKNTESYNSHNMGCNSMRFPRFDNCLRKHQRQKTITYNCKVSKIKCSVNHECIQICICHMYHFNISTFTFLATISFFFFLAETGYFLNPNKLVSVPKPNRNLSTSSSQYKV